MDFEVNLMGIMFHESRHLGCLGEAWGVEKQTARSWRGKTYAPCEFARKSGEKKTTERRRFLAFSHASFLLKKITKSAERIQDDHFAR